MIVYIAAQYSRKNEMSALVSLLRDHNIHVTSRWLQETLFPTVTLAELSPAYWTSTAVIDLEDIDKSDTIVFFSEDPLVGTPRGGRHVEFGYALAKGKRIVVIGNPENIFHFLPQIVHYSTLQHFLEAEEIHTNEGI